MSNIQRLLAETLAALNSASTAVTLGEAATRYVATKANLSPHTHKLYRLTLLRAARDIGWDKPLHSVTALDLHGHLTTLPSGAAHSCSTRLRAFYTWAARLGLVWTALKPEAPHKTIGHIPWTATDIAAFRLRWPPGSRPRFVMEAALSTGLRRSDLCVALWSMPGRLRTSKTGTTVYIAAQLAATRAAFGAPLGRRLKPHTLGLLFTQWSRAAGLENRTLHGIRKAFAQQAALSGCSAPELMAMAGWTTLSQASYYIAEVDREALAESGLKKLKPA